MWTLVKVTSRERVGCDTQWFTRPTTSSIVATAIGTPKTGKVFIRTNLQYFRQVLPENDRLPDLSGKWLRASDCTFGRKSGATRRPAVVTALLSDSYYRTKTHYHKIEGGAGSLVRLKHPLLPFWHLVRGTARWYGCKKPMVSLLLSCTQHSLCQIAPRQTCSEG